MIFNLRKHLAAELGYHEEIERLVSLEKGQIMDKILRFVGVPVAGVLFYFYTGSVLSFWWSGGYLSCYFIYRLYLSSLKKDVTPAKMNLAHLIFVIQTLCFAWFPAMMLIETDRNLVLVGAALIGIHLVHLVHRGDTSLVLICGVTAAVSSIMAMLLIAVLPQITNRIAIFGIVASWIGLVLYLGQSLLAARHRILSESAAKREIYQAQKLAALGQLAGGIAHDFNNILTAISGNLELYRLLTQDEDKEEVINAAHESSQRAARIVNQILVYARKSPVEFRTVNANDPLLSVSVMAEHLVPANIRFVVQPLETEAHVNIDPDQLVTAMMNLVLNAVDAIHGGGRISLSAKSVQSGGTKRVVGGKVLPEGQYLAYEVADTGEGIPDDILKSVVDPFFTTKPVGKGTGLGLSMAVSIAESFGGGLEIETSTKGTKMTICVPVLPKSA